MEKMKWIKKGISALLALNMVLSSVPLPAFAATTDNLCEHHTEHTAECGYREGSAGSACTHEHSEDCYKILNCLHECGTECEQGCTHECTVENGCITMELDCRHVHGDCGYSEGTAEVPCGHVHNESCGYVEVVYEVLCDCAETDESGNLIHTEGCGYVAAVEGQPCGHTACDDTCGYASATEGTPCTHVCEVKVDSDDSCYKLLCSHSSGGHDDACGYAEAVEAHECHYECAECAAALTAEDDAEPTTEATTEPSTEATEPSTEATEPSTEATESTTETAPVCDCGTDDPAIHATTCAVYVAPENPQCYCVEKCTALNEWCDICGFDYTACAGGWDEAADYATTPTYIASIGVAQDGSSGSTGVNDCKNELSGHTIIDRDLNDGAGGDYVYMGYKTTTDPSKAITGIVFRVGENPPDSITYGDYTFYLVGGSYETNTASQGGYIDLNAYAGGVYIYTYVTRDSGYGAPLTAMTVNESSSYSGWTTGTNTSGNVIDLNQDAGGDYLYLHYQRFSATVSATYYYLTSSGSRTSSTQSATVKNHQETMTKVPSVTTSVTYNGNTYTFKGWREDNSAGAASTTSPSVTYMTSPKTYRAVYSRTLTLRYDANGGTGAPSAQTATQYLNAGSSSVSLQTKTFTISSTAPTHAGMCKFLGWATGSSATSAAYTPGGSISVSADTTLYAVWQDHNGTKDYVNNGTDHTYTWTCCGKSVTEAHSYTDCVCVCGSDIHEYDNGFCTVCGGYEPAVLNSDGVYEIGNAGQLYWFAQLVNHGTTGATGKLMKDITVNENVLTESGELNGTPERVWTPIGNDSNRYTGTFDGNGKTVSGLYYNDRTNYVGLFGYADGGEIRNVGVIDSYLSGTSYVGGVVGYNWSDTITDCYNTGAVSGSGDYVGGVVGCIGASTAEDCYNTGTVSGSGDYVGGVAGFNSYGTITNCHNTGMVSGDDYVGGVAGYNSNATITNCHNTGMVSGDYYVGGVAGYNSNDTVTSCYNTGTVSGSYWVGGVVGFNNYGTVTSCYSTGSFSGGNYVGGVVSYNAEGTVTNCYYDKSVYSGNAIGADSGTSTNVEGKTTEQFASGEVAYLLNNSVSGGTPWKQTIGTDAAPNFTGEAVYQVLNCKNETAYSNTNENIGHIGGTATCTEKAVCTVCGESYGELGNHSTTADDDRAADCDSQAYCSACESYYGEVNLTNHDETVAFDSKGFCPNGCYEPATLNAEGFYEIFNAGQLYWFAQQVNIAGNTAANGKLMADIDLENRTWYPIGLYDDIAEAYGSPVQKQYVGTFDGNNHTVSNFTAIGNGSQGLFGYCNQNQTQIKNLGVINATVSGWNAGAVAGYCANLTNCYAVGCTITGASDTNTQAVTISSVGGNNGAVVITNCWAYNCKLIVGEGEANYVMHPVGGIRASDDSVNIVKNCYYGEIVTDAEFTSTTGATEKTEAQFASGEVAYLLGTAWGQTIGTDDYPILGGRKVYYGYADCKATEKTYANSPLAETELVHSFNANGFCSVCDEYEPASDAEGDGYYDIDNAGKLYWFAQQVRDGNTTINGILTDNIVVNENVLKADGTLNGDGSNFRVWIPIDNDTNSYTGTFEGNDKRISGLYHNNSETVYLGLFSFVGEGGTVRNVGIIDSYLHGDSNVGGVAGANRGTVTDCYNSGAVSGVSYVGGVVGFNSYGTIANCCNTGSVSGTGQFTGGVSGCNFDGTIESCYNTGAVSGKSAVGGVTGITDGTITDCYNTGAVSGSARVGGVAGKNDGTVKNCYNTGTVSGSSEVYGVIGFSTSKVENCYYLDTTASGGFNGRDAVGAAEPKTAAQFASGEVAYLLNGDQSTIVFKQTIGTDAAPGFTGETVYAITNCVGTGTGAYSNTKTQLPHDYSNNNGFCTVCDAYEPATDSDSNNYYEIDNAGKLYWFAVQVNSGNTNINGELKANIVINKDVLAEMAKEEPNTGSFRVWTPIGDEKHAYTGDFHGHDHTVSGLFFDHASEAGIGLFGYVGSGGSVHHVGVIDSFFRSCMQVGGVVGLNQGTVQYVYNSGTVIGDGSVGGVVGANDGTVTDCYNTGSVSGNSNIGDLVGYNSGAVKNCYSTGTVSDDSLFGGLLGSSMTSPENCYYLADKETDGHDGTIGKTAAQFASGEVAYLLNGSTSEGELVWKQTIGTDAAPKFTGDTVYYGYTSCGDVQMVYTNDPKASAEKPEHTGEATYTVNSDGTHSASYSCCGTTVTEDHTYENGKCACGLYDLWVAGEQISDSHLTVSGTTGTATYDPATDTLTLNDFDNGEQWYSFTNNGFSINAAVYTLSDLNVVLEGKNSLFATGNGFNVAIQSQAALTIGGDGTLDAGTIYSANGTIINGGTLDIDRVDIAFDSPSTTINGGNVNVLALVAVTYGTLTVNGGRVVLENSGLSFGYQGTILIGEGMAVYDENGALIENPDFSTLPYALIQALCDHTQATPSYTWTEDPITLTVTVSCTACGETFTGSTTDMATSDDGFTTTYTASVTLNGKTYTDSKTVSNQVTSVNIAWGEMDFTYTDESGWNNPNTAWVQVENTGNTSVSVTYTYDTERTDITGSFFDGTATVTAPVAIDTESTKKIWLRLDGTPSEALNNTTIGSVKLTIE